MFLRKIALAFLPLIAFSLLGCQSGGADQQKSATPAAAATPVTTATPAATAATATTVKKLTDADNGTTITVKEGTEIVVELDGNISTGYSWDVSSIQGTVTQKGKVTYGSTPQPPGQPIRVGVPGKFTATFESGPAGTSTVNMEYKRPFDRTNPPAKTFKVKIVVTP